MLGSASKVVETRGRRCIDNVRLNHRLMPNHIMLHKVITNIFYFYAPQAVLSVNGKVLC